MDDYTANIFTTGQLAVGPGGNASGFIETPFDTDWFKISLNAGTIYLLGLGGTLPLRSTNSMIELYDASGRILAFSFDGGFLNYPEIRFTPASTGNYFVGVRDLFSVTGTYTVSAAVGSVDTTAPIVQSYSPVDDANSVSITTNIIVTFSEPIRRGNGNIVLRDSDGLTVASFDASNTQDLSVSGSQLTINPPADLAYGTTYTIEIASGTIQDRAGNKYSGTNSYNFTTLTPAIVNLNGTAGNDTLKGTRLNEFITGGAGYDSIDGGIGLDTAVFSGPASAYRVVADATRTGGTIYDLRSGVPDGIDTLTSIEYLQFSDKILSLPEIALGSQVAPDTIGTQVYRFAKVDNGQYFYTGNTAERDQIVAGLASFRYEGPVYNAQDNWVTGYNPVFRFANLSNGGYFYTSSAAERDSVFSNYPNLRYEGASFFVPTSAGPDMIQVFRLANLVTGGYLFTTSQSERTYAVSLGSWRDEGVAFHAPRSIALAFGSEETFLSEGVDQQSFASESERLIAEDQQAQEWLI